MQEEIISQIIGHIDEVLNLYASSMAKDPCLFNSEHDALVMIKEARVLLKKNEHPITLGDMEGQPF
jgi:hypothetical protein